MRLRAFCGGGDVGRTGRPHVVLKAFQGSSTRRIHITKRRKLHAKIGVFVVDDIAFHAVTIRGSTPSTCMCARVKGKRVQIDRAQMNGFRTILIRERHQLSISKLEC